MAYRNLDEFLVRLEQAGAVLHKSMDSLSAAGVTEALHASEAVTVFEDPANSIRIATNLFGTRQRVEQALRVVSLDLISERLSQLLDLGKPGAFSSLVGHAMSLFSALRTTSNKRAPNTLTNLPFEGWVARFPDSLRSNTSPSLLAMLMTDSIVAPAAVSVTSTGLEVESSPGTSKDEQIALVFGGDPAFILAGLTPLPELIHRSYLASWLRERPIEVMQMPGFAVDLPANLEAVVFGRVEYVRQSDKGQFLEPLSRQTGIRVSGVWQRTDPVYIHWSSRNRDVVRDSLFSIFMPLLRRAIPGLSDMQLREMVSGAAALYRQNYGSIGSGNPDLKES